MRDERAQIGEGLTSSSCVAVISGSLVHRFSSYRNYRWGDSSSFFVPNMASEAMSECLVLKCSWGSMPPDPLSLFSLNAPEEAFLALQEVDFKDQVQRFGTKRKLLMRQQATLEQVCP